MNLSVKAFHTAMKTLGKFSQRDFDVVVHGDLKWGQFAKHINFKGKRVHDVGCHVGLTAMRASSKGAEFAWGTDKRKDIVDFNNAISIRFLPVKKGLLKINFIQRTLDNVTDIEADIVLCLGVIHKFPDGEYQLAVKHLCDAAKETLVVETCFDYSAKKPLNVRKHPDPKSPWPYHSRVSKPYLRTLLSNNGFKVVREIPSVAYAHHQRETWIAERSG